MNVSMCGIVVFDTSVYCMFIEQFRRICSQCDNFSTSIIYLCPATLFTFKCSWTNVTLPEFEKHFSTAVIVSTSEFCKVSSDFLSPSR